MIYKAQGYRIDLGKITRLYPAATVRAGGETAQVSLEWAQMKAGQVPIEAYVLVFDFDPLGEVPEHRIELRYGSEAALIAAMHEVAALLEKR